MITGCDDSLYQIVLIIQESGRTKTVTMKGGPALAEVEAEGVSRSTKRTTRHLLALSVGASRSATKWRRRLPKG